MECGSGGWMTGGWQPHGKCWRNAEMALRWTTAGLLEAKKTFRRLKAAGRRAVMPHSRARMALSRFRVPAPLPQPATAPDGPRRLGLGLLDIEQPGQHPGLPGVSTTGRPDR